MNNAYHSDLSFFRFIKATYVKQANRLDLNVECLLKYQMVKRTEFYTKINKII
jgi:hypothetical protein